MARKTKFSKQTVASIRFEEELYTLMIDLAHLETVRTGSVVTASQLVREACSFVYEDNDRLRECFRRARSSARRKF